VKANQGHYVYIEPKYLQSAELTAVRDAKHCQAWKENRIREEWLQVTERSLYWWQKLTEDLQKHKEVLKTSFECSS
jgi:hypothetical protein